MATSDAQAAAVAAALPAVLAERSRDAFERMLAADVRWGGPEDTEQTCRDRRQAGDFYAGLLAADVQLEVLEVSVHDSQVLARLRITRPQGAPDWASEARVLLTVEAGLVTDIRHVGDDRADPAVIELLYFDGCPNHSDFLPHLQRLLIGHGIDSLVCLVNVTNDQDAQRLRFLGSPSLRVNGQDIEPRADERNGYALQCRLYATSAGLTGTPPDAWILSALHP